MRFDIHLRELADGLHAVVIDTHDNDRVVGVADTIRDAEVLAAYFERKAA